jgi:serine/threonine protein phosphatase 1
MKRFALGDVHGELEKLKEVLKLSNFNYEEDELISLGDLVDRGPDSYGVVEELLKVKNLIAIRGNHDNEWLKFIKTGHNALINQGGRQTITSYENAEKDFSVHLDFFKYKQINYHIDEDNNCFVHGGFNRHENIRTQAEHVLYWDRDLFLSALSYSAMKDNRYKFKMLDNFNKVYVAHTPTTYWNSSIPMKAANIINLDTGSGKGGLLTLYNLDTDEYWQA